MSIFAFSASFPHLPPIHSVEKWPQASFQSAVQCLSLSHSCFQGNKTLWLPKPNVLWNPDPCSLSPPLTVDKSFVFKQLPPLAYLTLFSPGLSFLPSNCDVTSATSLMFFLILSINILSLKDLIYMLALILIPLQIMLWIHKPCIEICIKCLLKWINNYPLQSLIVYKFQAYKTLP